MLCGSDDLLKHLETALGIMKGDTAHVRERVQKYRNHPALAGWYMFDEPEIPKVDPNALHRAYMRVHTGDPAHPAMLLIDATPGHVVRLAGFSYWVRSRTAPAGFAGR